MLCTEALPSVTPQSTTQASLSEKEKQILTLVVHGIIPMTTATTKFPQLKAIFSQATTSTPIFQTQTQVEQLSGVSKVIP